MTDRDSAFQSEVEVARRFPEPRVVTTPAGALVAVWECYPRKVRVRVSQLGNVNWIVERYDGEQVISRRFIQRPEAIAILESMFPDQGSAK